MKCGTVQYKRCQKGREKDGNYFLLTLYPSLSQRRLKKMFHETILSALHRGTYDGNHLDFYCSAWHGILSTLFPLCQGFIIRPALISTKRSIFIEVSRWKSRPSNYQTVLIVQILSQNEWPKNVPKAKKDLDKITKGSFKEMSGQKVYWICAIGNHWRYGERECGEDDKLKDLSRWHHQIDDEKSYDELMKLSYQVRELRETCLETENQELLTLSSSAKQCTISSEGIPD